MPKYSKVEDSKSLTVKLPRDLYLWIRDEASSRRVPPCQVIIEALERGRVAPKPTEAPKPRAEKVERARVSGVAQKGDHALFAQVRELLRDKMFTQTEICNAAGIGRNYSQAWEKPGIIRAKEIDVVCEFLKKRGITPVRDDQEK